ncbi:DUF4184 family protein [Streptacidiphilus rugosus]|uniref:DUF4184 family protein n=1 Tax=Streptacidiphilus rugosus TaxID=405783 RepID=UPI00056C5B52|nr:DUF4184 family protein [Streptacidiphilus rugosus]
MPFTLSHPAAVLPFLRGGRARGRLVASALVFGSMAPDVPYFAGAFAWGDLAHSWWAVPTLDVGIAAVLFGAWHLVLRAPLVGLLPGRWASAAEELTAPSEAGVPWSRTPWFLLSAALGAATHVGWDGFTHPDRFGTRLLPALQTGRVLGEPPYALLQYGCSALGLAVLGWYAWRELRRAAVRSSEPAHPQGNRRLALLLTVSAAVAGAAYRYAAWVRPGMPLTSVIPAVAFGAVAGACLALVLYAVLRLRRA